jgi:hypothetical protein
MKRSREHDEGDYFEPDDPESTGISSQPAIKIVELDSSLAQDDIQVIIQCPLPPHKETIDFESYQAYETHYTKFHTNRCIECGRNLPSNHYLSLHIEEVHDPLVAVQREKGMRTVCGLIFIAVSFWNMSNPS